jgi:hypothetical protein
LDHIINNYNNLSYDLIFKNNETIHENYIPSDDYILWHTKYIGTDISDIKLKSGIISSKNIKNKSIKYYINIIANYNNKFIKYALYDIFFSKIKICILICGFMKNYEFTIENYFKLFPNYHVDFYLLTYDTLDINISEKFNSSEFLDKWKLKIKKYIIKDFSLIKNTFEDPEMNKLYYTSFDIFELYHQLNENYFIYIHTRPDLIFYDLDQILEDNFTYIINNKIILNCFNNIISDHPFDGFAICNIFSAHTYFNFHKYIENYKDSCEHTFFNYLNELKLDIIQTKICSITRIKKNPIPSRLAILRGKR